MSFNLNSGIPESDLPVKSPSGAARVRYVDGDGKSYSSAMPDVIAASAIVQDAIDGIVADAESDIGAIVNGMGYLPPVAFASGLNVNSSRFTVTYGGVTYAPVADAIPFTTTGTFNPVQWRVVQGVTVADLAASSGAALVGFQQSGAGAVQRTMLDRSRELYVCPEDYGAVGDGVADDTAAVHAAFNYSATKNIEVRGIAGKTYRVTSGYVNSTTRGNLTIRGPGRINERLNDQKGAVFLLDSTDPASFFLQLSQKCTFTAHGVVFKCAQYVQDRKFIRIGGPSNPLIGWYFYETSFENVEKPIVLEPGLYFQNAALRDVQFIHSGTIHSEGDATGDNLLGTFLRLDNVNHEGSVPANTEKQVCNLQAIRLISADNFLLEGSLPSDGWTVLVLSCPYNANYTRYQNATIINFHSEWNAFQPTYVVDQIGGTIRWNHLTGINPVSKYKISALGKAVIAGTEFSGIANDPTTFFELQDGQCLVEFESCPMRTMNLLSRGFIHKNTQYANATDGHGQVVVSNTGSRDLYRWNGEIVSTQGDLVVYVLGGTTISPSTDPIYGRKLVVTSVGGNIDASIRAKIKPGISAGDQLFVVVRLKLPTYTTGNFRVATYFTGGGGAAMGLLYGPEFSGQVVDVVLHGVVKPTDTINSFGFGASNIGTTDLSGTLEIMALNIGVGRTIPQSVGHQFPVNTTSYAAAAPTIGAFARGDIVHNTAPTAGGNAGWICIGSGAPGTWRAFGAIDP